MVGMFLLLGTLFGAKLRRSGPYRRVTPNAVTAGSKRLEWTSTLTGCGLLEPISFVMSLERNIFPSSAVPVLGVEN